MEFKGLFAVIPAYNVAVTLPEVVKGLKNSLPGIECIVINDGSRDPTAKIIKKLDVMEIEHSTNRGKGAALRTGFTDALNRGAEFILTIDSDGQHKPGEAVKLLQAIADYNYDVVVGNRMQYREKMPIHRKLSNRITSWLISMRTAQEIQDSQCGFRVIRAEVLRNVVLTTNRFDMESELLLKAALKGYQIGSVEISTVYSSKRESSMSILDVFRFIKIYIRSFFW